MYVFTYYKIPKLAFSAKSAEIDFLQILNNHFITKARLKVGNKSSGLIFRRSQIYYK